MANTNAPFGFRHVSSVGGGAPTYQIMPKAQIAYNDTQAVYTGDPVYMTASGYVTATAGSNQLYGVFGGCWYLNPTTKMIQFSPYWPGVAIASTSVVNAMVIADPFAVFVAQMSGAAATQASVGANVGFTLGTGNTLNGISGATVTSASEATTATLPFRVIGIAETAYQGYDPTGSYNQVYVTFNNQSFHTTTGI